MNKAHKTQFGCYIYFIKKFMNLVNNVRDPEKTQTPTAFIIQTHTRYHF